MPRLGAAGQCRLTAILREDNPFARPAGKLEVDLLSVNDFSIFEEYRRNVFKP